MPLSICWTYLLDVAIDDVKKSCTSRLILRLSIDAIELVFKITSFF